MGLGHHSPAAAACLQMSGSDQFRIPGRAILREVLTAYRPYRSRLTASRARAVIIRFEVDPATAPLEWIMRMAASRISAEQKKQTFRRLGVHTEEVVLTGTPSRRDFGAHLAAANDASDVVAIIVQLPAPGHLVDLLDRIDPTKDIDALGTGARHTACATADGIARLAMPSLAHGASVAVVGGRGFVGSGVVTLLRAARLEPLVLDLGDDLRRVRDVDVVISTTGQAGLLTPEHLHAGHALVVDSGFAPHTDGALGDVRPDAATAPQTITPVPGGVGPVEMAVLAERLIIYTVAPDLTSWRFLGRGNQPATTAAQTVAVQAQPSQQTRARMGQSAGQSGPPRRSPGSGPTPGQRPRRGRSS